MDRHRSDRFDDRSGDRFGDGGGRRMPSRWSSDSPTERHPRYPRGGAGGAGDGGRYHPYRGSQDLPAPPGGGFRGGDSGSFSPPVSVGGPRRGFSGRSGSPGKLKDPLFSFRKLYLPSFIHRVRFHESLFHSIRVFFFSRAVIGWFRLANHDLFFFLGIFLSPLPPLNYLIIFSSRYFGTSR